jgi:hypothetical protein
VKLLLYFSFVSRQVYYIDKWHDSDSDINLELHEFLEMSWEEYSLWAIKPSLLEEIVNEREILIPKSWYCLMVKNL